MRLLDVRQALQTMDPFISRSQSNEVRDTPVQRPCVNAAACVVVYVDSVQYIAQGTQHSAKELKWDSMIDYELFLNNLRNTLLKLEDNWAAAAQPVVVGGGWMDESAASSVIEEEGGSDEEGDGKAAGGGAAADAHAPLTPSGLRVEVPAMRRLRGSSTSLSPRSRSGRSPRRRGSRRGSRRRLSQSPRRTSSTSKSPRRSSSLSKSPRRSVSTRRASGRRLSKSPSSRRNGGASAAGKSSQQLALVRTRTNATNATAYSHASRVSMTSTGDPDL